MKKIWIDDIRNPPDDNYDIARNYSEAIALLSDKNYDHACIDHDLADFDVDGREKTGYDVLLWLTQRKYDGLWVPKSYVVLTANPSAKPRMLGVIERYLM
jgi:hypothetical protein